MPAAERCNCRCALLSVQSEDQEPETGQEVDEDQFDEEKSFKGGAGSGNFGHSGRPGEVGGSGGGGVESQNDEPSGGGAAAPTGVDKPVDRGVISPKRQALIDKAMLKVSNGLLSDQWNGMSTGTNYQADRLTDEQKALYKNTAEDTLHSMSDKAITAFNKNVQEIRFFSSCESLTRYMNAEEKAGCDIDKGDLIGGCFSYSRQTGLGVLHIDGDFRPKGHEDEGGTARETYSHEFSHTIDRQPGHMIAALTVDPQKAETFLKTELTSRHAPADVVEGIIKSIADPEKFTSSIFECASNGIDVSKIVEPKVTKGGSMSITDDPKWIKAFKAEILPSPDNQFAVMMHGMLGGPLPKDIFPLSAYAASKPAEGWAEFGRLVHTQPEKAKEFKECYAIWKKKGFIKDVS